MPRTLEVLGPATTEAAEAREWYEARSPKAAVRFVRELDLAIAEVLENPERWPVARSGTRKYRFGGRFPFSVIYTFDDERVRVIAVAHAKRRPGYWDNRVN